jgi:hypothetical protein
MEPVTAGVIAIGTIIATKAWVDLGSLLPGASSIKYSFLVCGHMAETLILSFHLEVTVGR